MMKDKNNSLRATQRGFSLVEMLTAAAVLSVVASLSTGSWRELIGKLRLQSVAQELAADVQLARSSAVALNRPVRLDVQQQAAGACVLAYTGAQGACTCTPQGVPTCEADEQVLKSHWLPANGRVTVSANVTSMRFDPTVGTVSPTATLRIGLADGRALAQVVNIMGRVRTCSPGGLVSGVAAC
jgi:type IV fimbrial biogenesis protein FimT